MEVDEKRTMKGGIDIATKICMLSYPLNIADPLPPAIPPPHIEPFLTIERDGARVFTITVRNHSGTHVDAPAHVIPDGLCISDFEPKDFWFWHPVLIDLDLSDEATIEPEHLRPHADVISQADLLLLRLGYGSIRRSDPARYCTKCPGFSVRSAEYVRHSFPTLRAIGMDVPSFACIARLDETMRAHNVVLEGRGRRFLIIEDMKLNLDLHDLRAVCIAPWIIDGVDSAPCAVYGYSL
jgi:arylformamidase